MSAPQHMDAPLPRFSDILADFDLFCGSSCCPEVDAQSGVVHCGCTECARWHAFTRGTLPVSPFPQYEVLTSEMVHSLAAYLLRRCLFYRLHHARVLEVGAGSGCLSYHLRRAMMQAVSSVKPLKQPALQFEVIATDNNSLGLLPQSCVGSRGEKSRHVDDTRRHTRPRDVQCRAAEEEQAWQCCLVEQKELVQDHAGVWRPPREDCVVGMDAEAAVSLFQPHIIIAAWMPMGADWTAAFRRQRSVREYILIGEKDGGICGHPVLTWNNSECDRWAVNFDEFTTGVPPGGGKGNDPLAVDESTRVEPTGGTDGSDPSSEDGVTVGVVQGRQEVEGRILRKEGRGGKQEGGMEESRSGVQDVAVGPATFLSALEEIRAGEEVRATEEKGQSGKERSGGGEGSEEEEESEEDEEGDEEEEQSEEILKRRSYVTESAIDERLPKRVKGGGCKLGLERRKIMMQGRGRGRERTALVSAVGKYAEQMKDGAARGTASLCPSETLSTTE